MDATRSALVAGVLSAAMLAACAHAPPGAIVLDSPASLPSVQDREAERLARLRIGMLMPEFRAVFPEAYVAGQSGRTTAYEFVRIQKYVTQADIDRQNFWWGVGSPDARELRQALWFYFYDERLVKWGRPQDWPEPNELIIREGTQGPAKGSPSGPEREDPAATSL